jgi:hypothetical protein
MNHQYRKKPIVIEAWQVIEPTAVAEDPIADPEWLKAAFGANQVRWITVAGPTHILIETLEGTMRADIGDWIIQGVKGELYPCKADIFAATYDAVGISEQIDEEGVPVPHTIAVELGHHGVRVPVDMEGRVRWVTVNNFVVQAHYELAQDYTNCINTFIEAQNDAAKAVIDDAIDIGLGYMENGKYPVIGEPMRLRGVAVDDAVGTASKVGGLPYEPADKSDSEIAEEVVMDMVVDAAMKGQTDG